MCAVDRIETAGDKPFMAAFGLGEPEIGPIAQTNYPMRNRPIVRLADDGGREILDVNWGLIPAWAKEAKVGRRAYNARMESLIEGKPTFRAAFKTRRCLVIGTSYLEHREEDGKNIPYEFLIDGGAPYAYAGLWEAWDSGAGPILSATMVTTVPNELVENYQDRMPVILRPDDYEIWLNPTTKREELLALMTPFPEKHMSVRRTTLPPRARKGEVQGDLFELDA